MKTIPPGNLIKLSPTLLTIALITIIALNVNPTSSIRCYCSVCGNNTECETSNDSDSECYKSVQAYQQEGKYVRENGSLVNSVSYGCLSGGGSISYMQCRVNTETFTGHQVMMKCCRDRDYCNEEFSDPSVADNRTWNVPENQIITENGEDDNDFLGLYYRQILVVAGILVTFLFFIIMKIIHRCWSVFCHKPHSNESQASTCFLESDLDKFNQFVTKSSASSHSTYSISDDICRKTEPSQVDDSFVPNDMTSGIGEQVLTQRTMARAVGSNKTDPVGNGRFGRVFRGSYHGEDVAVKAFKSIDQESWRREDTIFRTLNHDNIVRFIASEVTSVENSIEIWMFLEYCPYGSLCDYLDHNEILGPQQAVRILYSIINGLNYLHEDYAQASRSYKPSIAHRDIKSRNILMKTPDCCCIADFGHALIKIDEDSLDYGKYQNLQVGTIRYMAPEILRMDSSLNYRAFTTFAQADLYQYGLILWEVCQRTALDILHPAGNHKLPYDGVVPSNPAIQDMVKIVCEDQYRPPRLEKWDKYPIMKKLAELMLECWRPNPKARMETLGVKLKLKSLYDHIQMPYHGNNLINYSQGYRFDRDRTRSSDVTL